MRITLQSYQIYEEAMLFNVVQYIFEIVSFLEPQDARLNFWVPQIVQKQYNKQNNKQYIKFLNFTRAQFVFFK